MYLLGIDVGTGGVRALVVDRDGQPVAQAQRAFPQTAHQQPGRFEQDPHMWREALFDTLRQMSRDLEQAGQSAQQIDALSVTSTSGTLCLVDDEGQPVTNAIMYSDLRAVEEAAAIQEHASDLAAKLATRFAPSYGISKLLWVRHHAPDLLHRARWAVSPTDVALGWLSGCWGYSDWTNMLKWGYDVVDLRWPRDWAAMLDLPERLFPQVVAPGTVLGRVSEAAAEATGLSPKTAIVAGATDGNASFLASGAAQPGDWNSTLGTTLVLKGLSPRLIKDPQGRIYCHRHPDGAWLPGGASSTGADCLRQRFDKEDWPRLNGAALGVAPTDLIVYPLTQRGERFPFSAPQAEGFELGSSEDEPVRYAAHLEGIAYVERLAYETVRELGAPVGDVIYATGGATNSRASLQIRADVLQRTLRVPVLTGAAMGAAILAARGLCFDAVSEAAGAMVRYGDQVTPRPELATAYDDRYLRFIEACRERGYLS